MEIINYNEFAITAIVPTTVLFPRSGTIAPYSAENEPLQTEARTLRSRNGAFFTPSATRVTEKHLDIELPWMHCNVAVMLLSLGKWLIRSPINTSESKATVFTDHLWFLRPLCIYSPAVGGLARKKRN